MRVTNTDIFIDKSKSIHGDKYDYSKVDYKGCQKKVCIICPIHGEFWQTPRNHLQKRGCRRCFDEYRNNKNPKSRLKLNEFIDRSQKMHNGKYDYSKVEYKNNNSEVCIICPIHGEFWQIPKSHLKGHGCAACSGKKHLTEDEFISKAKSIHGEKYDYSKVEYINNKKEVTIICPKHGEFWQRPDSHLTGKGCSKCSSSSGERTIRRILNSLEVDFYEQHKFDDCCNIFPLPFDFYLPNYNICIEYDGIQHFEPVEYFGGENKLKKQKINDNIKNKYCETNNIVLIRISYCDDANSILHRILS